MRTGIVGTVAAFWLSVSAAFGQEPRLVRPGARVRVLTTSGGALTGRLLSLDDAALRLETRTGRLPLVVSRQDVRGLELSLRRSQRHKGALIGLVVGVAAGALMAGDSSGSCPPPQDDFLGICRSLQAEYSSKGYLISAVFVGFAGAGIGALAAPGEKWETVMPDRLRLAAAPARGGGARFAVSLAF